MKGNKEKKEYSDTRYNNTYAVTYENEFGDRDVFFYDIKADEYTVARNQEPDDIIDFEIMTALKLGKDELPQAVRDYFDSLTAF